MRDIILTLLILGILPVALARPWLLVPESFKFVYEPFEGSIPPESL